MTTAFDITCYDKLYKRFAFLFEENLIQEICQSGNARTYKADHTLIEIGDDLHQIPFVISGSIKVMTEDKEGDELLLYYLEHGDTCAVTLNCCTRLTKSTVKAVIETDAEILFIPVERIEDWMIRYKSWRNYVLDSYNNRFNELLAAIDNIVFNSMEERLAAYLRDKVLITKDETLHVSHAEIANDLHSSRVVISRLMKKLEKNGTISQTRNRVVYNGLKKL